MSKSLKVVDPLQGFSSSDSCKIDMMVVRTIAVVGVVDIMVATIGVIRDLSCDSKELFALPQFIE